MNMLQKSSAIRPCSAAPCSLLRPVPLQPAFLASRCRNSVQHVDSRLCCQSAAPIVEPKHARVVCRAAASGTQAEMAAANGKIISSTEVPAFIQRDDMIDQLYRWSIIEAGEGGFRNFGLPMTVEPVYKEEILWGFNVGMFKDGIKLTDVGVMFDDLIVNKHEWLGKGEDGFPVLEGRVDEIMGKNIEIWKMDRNPVSEELRSAIRAYCTGLVGALNRYYAFGSVFVDDERG